MRPKVRKKRSGYYGFTLALLVGVVASIELAGVSPQRKTVAIENPLNADSSSSSNSEAQAESLVNRLKTFASSKFQSVQRAVALKNQRILFYALVQDQSKQPIPHARVLLSARQWFAIAPGMFDSRSNDTWVEADDKGRISHDAGYGDVICIKDIQRSGMDLEMKPIPCLSYEASGIQNGSIPTQNNPLVLNTWISKGRARLHRLSPSPNHKWSHPLCVNVITGKVSTNETDGSDLRIELRFKSKDQLRTAGPGDFPVSSMEIRALNGGVIRTDDVFLYEAPATGYSPRIQFTGTNDFRPQLESTRKFFFYYYTRNRFYGRCQITLSQSGSVFDTNVPIIVASSLSISGNRILQSDPNNEVSLSTLEREDLDRSSSTQRGRP